MPTNPDQRICNDSFTLLFFAFTLISSQCQTGVRDYEIFNEQLDSLGSWIIKAEEALEVQDPNGSTEPAVVQDRMEELKVFFLLFWGGIMNILKNLTLLPCLCLETHVEIQQYGS